MNGGDNGGHAIVVGIGDVAEGKPDIQQNADTGCKYSPGRALGGFSTDFRTDGIEAVDGDLAAELGGHIADDGILGGFVDPFRADDQHVILR